VNATEHFARIWFGLTLAALLIVAYPASGADTAAEIERESRAALEKLYREVPTAGVLAKNARAVMVFPDIVKGGLIIAGQYGKGALFEGDAVKAFYRTTAVSYGLQAGAQTFGYALLLMNDAALKHLDRSEGWELGVGPSVVVVNEGIAKNLTTTTARDDVYAFVFGQEGLMLGLGIQGSKITRIQPEK